MKSPDKLGSLPEVRTTPYEPCQEGDLEALAVHFGQRLERKYGLEKLRKIDEDNESLKGTIYDSVYDHIDMTEFYQEYIEACGDMGFNWHNYHYAEVFKMLKDDGYVTWGDNYGDN